MTLESYIPDLLYILEGALATLWLAAASLVIATLFGLVLALMQLHKSWTVRWPAIIYAFIIRGIPLLVLLVTFYFGSPYLGIYIDAWTGASLVIGIYFAAYMSEVFRAALEAIPKIQWESGKGLGLTGWALFKIVILPQTIRIALPPYINLGLSLVKNTSLASAVGVWELVASGRDVVERTLAAFTIYLTIAAIYFVICFTLSQLSQYLERRLSYDY